MMNGSINSNDSWTSTLPAGSPRPGLILGCGNPSRGDDALAPALLAQLALTMPPALAIWFDLLEDFQLQIEHTVDMERRQLVLFIDASLDAPAPFELQPLSHSRPCGYTTHAMTPAQLWGLFQQLHPQQQPQLWQLALRGYQFELGAPLSQAAQQNLQQSLDYLLQWLGQYASGWQQRSTD
ncbi:hydrogenase maturation protease [Ectothiorhodospiraceae bacterium BW-2]|nr:hydrogenase maturation protease [Ectothiorhodospiraceae bacterium BW-2]